MSDNTTIVSILIILLIAVLSVVLKKLTVMAGAAGSLIAMLLWESFGYIGILLLGSFFILGSIATSWKFSQKNSLPSASSEDRQRRTGQVLANGGVAGILAVLALLFPNSQELFQMLMAGSFAAALSDTFSSEFGNVYGKRFYNICSFRKDQRGENGVVSLEGSIAGVLGAGIIAALYTLIEECGTCFFILVIAGITGNLVDSILGAKFERKGLIGNNLVNFLNTSAGAVVGWGLVFVLNVKC